MAEENFNDPRATENSTESEQSAAGATAGASGAPTGTTGAQSGVQAGAQPTQVVPPISSEHGASASQPTTVIPTSVATESSQPTTVIPTSAASQATGTASQGAHSVTGDDRTPSPYRMAPQYGAYQQGHQSGQPTTQQPTAQSGQNAYGTQSGQHAGQQTGYTGSTNGAGYQAGGSSNANSNGHYGNQYGAYGNSGNSYGNANSPYGATNGSTNGQGGGNGGNGGYNSPFGAPFNNNGNNGNNGVNPNGTTKSKSGHPVLTAVVAAVVTGALCLGLGYCAITDGWVKVPTSSSLASVGSTSSSGGSAVVEGTNAADWASVVNAVSPTVVSIQATLSNGTAQGSGAILDTDGHVVTNNHVVEGATAIQITLNNDDIYEATVVGTDPTTDLAVLQITNPPSNLTAITFADSDSLAAGEAVLAIGNPLGYEGTSTTGIVSALNRPVSVMDEESSTTIVTNAVQIDAAINPGNSGGPTFNAAGQVIGINSSIATASSSSSSDSAGSIGIGFAIPSNLVKTITDEIIQTGSATHVALGITITSDTVTADGVTRGAAKVNSVVSGSPAEKAGLKTGDQIVAYNGNAVTNSYSLLGFVRAATLGQTATLTVVRDGNTIQLNVTFDQEESDVNGSSSSSSSKDSNSNGSGSDSNGSGSDSNGSDSNRPGSGSDGSGSDDDSNSYGFTDPFGFW